MIRLPDRTLILSFSVIALSTVVASILHGHGVHRTDGSPWSSQHHASIETGTVRSATPEPDPASATAGTGVYEVEADESRRVEITRPFDGPDAADELESGETRDNAHASTFDRSLPSSIITHSKKQLSHSVRSTKERSRDRSESERSEAQSNDRAPVANEHPERSPQGEPQSVQTERADRSAISAVLLVPDESPPTALSTSGTADASIESSPGSADTQPLLKVTPVVKSRQDVKDELRRARMNGALPRFGNPDPYGPGGSPSSSKE